MFVFRGVQLLTCAHKGLLPLQMHPGDSAVAAKIVYLNSCLFSKGSRGVCLNLAKK